MTTLDSLLTRVAACRLCADEPKGAPLPHEPRPVLRAGAAATIAICGQAPGARVHASGIPFTDPSGDRLRAWMGVTQDEFYDVGRIAIVPMGFCFPGLDANGGDLAPRRECAPLWRAEIFAAMPKIRLLLLVGSYAQWWHLPGPKQRLTETVRNWRHILGRLGTPDMLPLPHPSWRNSGWLRKNLWFEAELLPVLKERVRMLLQA